VVGVSDLDRFVTAHVGLRLIPADSRSRLFSAFRKTLEGHGAFAEEFEVRESRREVRYFLVSAELVEADAFLPRRLAGIVREVTDRRRAQMALKASEQEQMRLLANLPGIAYRCDCEMPWPMLMVSEGARDLCGYPPEALLREGNVRYADLIHPDDLERVSTEIEVALRERRPFRLTYRIFPPDREVKWVWEQGRAIRDEEGKVLYLEGFIGDITDQRRIAQRLHQSEERFRLLSEATNDTLWDLDMASHRLWWSDGLRRVFGLERIPDSTFDKTWSPRVHPADLNRVLQEIREAITRGDETFETHYRFLRADGSFAEVTDRGQIIRDEDGRAYRMVGGMVDVSERRELEAQFFRAQRMESIGGLASGIAHDLNNLLSPIVMGMQLLQRTEQTPKSLRIISEIERSALRGTELVKQVLSFARGIDGQRIPIRLKHLFAELEGILHSTLPSGIRIRTHLPRDLRAVRADATQISQILLNLCVNARDAMPDGGHLWLRAENLVLDATEATRRNLGRVGPYVVIEVQDEGMGISPDLQKRIFEPFFTTKEAGKGTGLGLSTTLAIVRSHQGVVELENEEGVGSTFRILLPAMEGKASTEAVEDLKSAPRGNGEWILVVDDEASIRAITRDTLETFGYRVISAQDGAEGVARFAERRDEIALVLSDMVMPVLGGEGLVAAVHRLAPNLPVIGMSGSLSPEAHKRSFVDGVTRFLPKPISAVRLLQTVRECLEISA
jgi:PAS domain S-box-containing protein